MKYCDKCKLSVTGSTDRCPLCQGLLTPVDDSRGEDVFPFIPTLYRQYSLFFRLLIFGSIAAAVITLTINFLLPQSGIWSLFVVAGLLCLWGSLWVVFRKRRNIPKTILYQVLVLSLGAVLWDLLTHWKGWSLSYAIPALCTSAMLSMAIVAKVLRLRVEDYLIYLILDGLFALVPLIFYLCGLSGSLLATIICLAVSIISISFLLLFEGGNLLSELRRRLHL